jgi:apoptosis-inducing factor 2
MDSHRVVIAGLGDSGVLTAIRLARHADVIGISAKPALVSGQELGWRLSRSAMSRPPIRCEARPATEPTA